MFFVVCCVLCAACCVCALLFVGCYVMGVMSCSLCAVRCRLFGVGCALIAPVVYVRVCWWLRDVFCLSIVVGCNCGLVVVCCVLLFAGCWLSFGVYVCCVLFVGGWLLLLDCSLVIVECWLLFVVVRRVLFAVCCSLKLVLRSLSVVGYCLLTVAH